MKRIYQYLIVTGLGGLLCLFLTIPANAQRGGGHYDGGGRSGGGGGFSRGGGGGFSHSGGGFSGGSRSGGNFSRGGNGGFSGGGRSTNSFSAPRQSFQSGATRGNVQSYSYRGNAMNSTPSFSRSGPAYRGNIATGYRGGYAVMRGGYSRGGRYYPGGYSSRINGYRYSPWSNRGGYFYNRGFYRSSYYPRLGISLGILPYGYYPFYWGDARFYYSGGYFYQYNNNQYTVVEPPIGAAINSLPDNAQPISINGQQYYELNGVYYMPITKDDGSVAYQVAGKDGQLDTYSNAENGYAPQNDGYTGRNDANSNNQQTVTMPEIGDLFYSLPADSRKIKLNGEVYFVSPDDFYYQETRDQRGTKAYKVTGTPDDNPAN